MAQRIQFYPGQELLNNLRTEASEKKIAVNTLVIEILTAHYSQTNEVKTEGELEAQVLSEALLFAHTHPYKEFTLRDASPTFAGINQRGRKAALGHTWNLMLRENRRGLYSDIRQIFNEDGTPKRSKGNYAAVYVYEGGK